MAGEGKSGLALAVLMMLSAGSGLAVQQPADQGAPVVQEQPPPKLAVPVRVRVSQGVMQGLIVTKVAPKYPEKARKKRIQGTVVMHVIISKDGDIATVELVSGHPLLAPAAIDAAKQWKYKPYLLNGTPVEVESEIQVNFTLSGN